MERTFLISIKGIDKYKNLENLSLLASTPESNKKVDLENLVGIEKLTQLKSFEISYFRFDIKELKDKLSSLPELKEFTIDNINTKTNNCHKQGFCIRHAEVQNSTVVFQLNFKLLCSDFMPERQSPKR